jgi:hypothetical protein
MAWPEEKNAARRKNLTAGHYAAVTPFLQL